jgi:iron(III) transport system substrate-binding protein
VRHPLSALTAVAASAALLLSACGGDTQAGPDAGATPAATSDGVVTVYSGRAETLIGPILTRAGEELGLRVDVRYGSTSELAAQMVEEGGNTPADVFLAQDAGALGAVANAGLFTELPADILERVPSQYRADDDTWVGVTGRARVLVVSPDLVDSAPTSVYDLTDPKWKGKIGISPINGSFQSFVTAMRVMDGEERTEQWLRDIKANDALLYEGNSQIVQAIDAGQISIGLVNHYYLAELEQEAGRQLNARLVFTAEGDPGSLVNISGAGITERGAQDPDALALIDYLLGEDAQTYFAEETNEYPMTSGAPSPVGVPSLEALRPPAITLEQLEDLPGTLDMLQRVGLV